MGFHDYINTKMELQWSRTDRITAPTGPLKQRAQGDNHGWRKRQTYYRSVWKLKCTCLFSVLGQILNELDPETRSNGSGLKNGAARDQN
jgi:hypothetical protein